VAVRILVINRGALTHEGTRAETDAAVLGRLLAI
jgi:hypothetical protein